jgi:hypothetical protein
MQFWDTPMILMILVATCEAKQKKPTLLVRKEPNHLNRIYDSMIK